MESNRTLKILSLLGFLVFSVVSCWATATSLHLLLPKWPIIFAYLVTIGFYIIASMGSKMIADSFNQNIYLENRTSKLFLGLILTILFWLICSLPTNVHTLFFEASVLDEAIKDVSTTQSYVAQLSENTKNQNETESQIRILRKEVEAALTGLENEIDNIANPGFGDRAKTHLNNLAKALSIDVVPTLSYKGTSPEQRKMLKEQYRKIAYQHMENRILEIRHSTQDARATTYIPQAKGLDEELRGELKTLLKQKQSRNFLVDKGQENLIYATDATLSESYALIKSYADLIDLSEADKEIYLADNPVTHLRKMFSVVEVWKMFFRGDLAGYEVWLWVIISVLIDLSAFVFFGIAFKREV